jgi:hypothetical protein
MPVSVSSELFSTHGIVRFVRKGVSQNQLVKVLTSVKPATSDVPMNLKRESAKRNAERPRCSMGTGVKIKLWEEPDPKSTNR